MITIRDLNLPLNYLELTPETRQAFCKQLIIDALKQSKAPATIVDKLDTINTVIQRSIEYNESVENYELAQILLDVQLELKNHYPKTRKKKLSV
jgi:hypothetical protein